MTFTGKIREAAKGLKRFDLSELCEAMKVRTYQDQRIIKTNIKALVKCGEFKSISTGRYLYIAKEHKTTLRQRLWDIARRMVYFTTDDLEQLTQGKRHTVEVFCGWMVKEGFAERIEKGKFRVVGKLKPDVPGKKKRE